MIMGNSKKKDSEKVISSKEKKKNNDILDYWTKDKMEKAKPVDNTVRKSKDSTNSD